MHPIIELKKLFNDGKKYGRIVEVLPDSLGVAFNNGLRYFKRLDATDYHIDDTVVVQSNQVIGRVRPERVNRYWYKI